MDGIEFNNQYWRYTPPRELPPDPERTPEPDDPGPNDTPDPTPDDPTVPDNFTDPDLAKIVTMLEILRIENNENSAWEVRAIDSLRARLEVAREHIVAATDLVRSEVGEQGDRIVEAIDSLKAVVSNALGGVDGVLPAWDLDDEGDDSLLSQLERDYLYGYSNGVLQVNAATAALESSVEAVVGELDEIFFGGFNIPGIGKRWVLNATLDLPGDYTKTITIDMTEHQEVLGVVRLCACVGLYFGFIVAMLGLVMGKNE